MRVMVTTWRVVCRKLLIIMLIYMLNHDIMKKILVILLVISFVVRKRETRFFKTIS